MRIQLWPVLLVACTSPASPGPPSADPLPATPRTDAAAQESEPSATPIEPSPPPPPLLGRDHRSVVACTTDADCGWDNPCMATRCIEAGRHAACEESTKPPGTCVCFEGGCTTRPDPLPKPTGTCEIRGCEVDRAAGTCVADTRGVPENIRARPGVNAGPSCDCPDPRRGCVMSWFDPVPCKSDRDCWVDPSPRRHPIARPKELRGRDFAPCKDGEVAPKCGDAGVCVLGPAFTC
jgi:hypothetical protein